MHAASRPAAHLRNVQRTACVRATAPTDLLVFSATDFNDLLASYCERRADLERLSDARLDALAD